MVNKEQVRAARAWLNITQQDLATATMIDKKTIARFELGVGVPHDRTLRDLRLALEAKGVEFLFEGTKGVGIRVTPPGE
jgi:transcriptional regulator with XRE-family HTH domain